jgi:hypothetical protein
MKIIIAARTSNPIFYFSFLGKRFQCSPKGLVIIFVLLRKQTKPKCQLLE